MPRNTECAGTEPSDLRASVCTDMHPQYACMCMRTATLPELRMCVGSTAGGVTVLMTFGVTGGREGGVQGGMQWRVGGGSGGRK